MRKILCILLAMIMCLSTLSVAAATPMDIIVDQTTVEYGETEAIVNISIPNNPGIALIAFEVNYDNTAMTLESATLGNIFTGNLGCNLEAVPFVFNVYTGIGNKEDSGTLAILKFKLNDNCKAKQYNINLTNVEAYNIDEENVAFAVKNGKITVKQSESTDVTPITSAENETDTEESTKEETQEEVTEPTPAEKPSTTVKFEDVKEDDWYFDYVTGLAEKGIVSGIGNGNFAPNANVTREQFLKMLLESTNIEAEECENTFTDVADDWYTTYVLKAKALGIVNGITDTQFGIGQNITRQDMAVMITRVLEKANIEVETKDVDSFDDTNIIAPYAQSAVKHMKSIGLIEGYNNQYRPNDRLTRAEAAKVISGLLKLI